MEDEIVFNHPDDVSKELRELRMAHEREKFRMDLELKKAAKKEWVKNVCKLPSRLMYVEIKIQYVNSAGKSTLESQMNFHEKEMVLLSPLLNIKSLEPYILNEIGTLEPEAVI